MFQKNYLNFINTIDLLILLQFKCKYEVKSRQIVRVNIFYFFLFRIALPKNIYLCLIHDGKFFQYSNNKWVIHWTIIFFCYFHWLLWYLYVYTHTLQNNNTIIIFDYSRTWLTEFNHFRSDSKHLFIKKTLFFIYTNTGMYIL